MNGVPLGELSPRKLIAKRNEFQLLLQDPYNALPPRTTVGRMIEESLRIRGGTPGKELRARVRDAMAEVGLSAQLYDELPNRALHRRPPAHLDCARTDPRSEAADPRRDLVCRSTSASRAS